MAVDHLGIQLLEGERVLSAEEDVIMKPIRYYEKAIARKTSEAKKPQSESPRRARNTLPNTPQGKRSEKGTCWLFTQQRSSMSGTRSTPVSPSDGDAPKLSKNVPDESETGWVGLGQELVNEDVSAVEGTIILTDFRLLFAWIGDKTIPSHHSPRARKTHKKSLKIEGFLERVNKKKGTDTKTKKKIEQGTQIISIPFWMVYKIKPFTVGDKDTGGFVIKSRDIRTMTFFWEGLVSRGRFQAYSVLLDQLVKLERPSKECELFPIRLVRRDESASTPRGSSGSQRSISSKLSPRAKPPRPPRSPAVKGPTEDDSGDEDREPWWHRVDVLTCDEFARMVNKSEQAWRLTSANTYFALSKTYPPILPVASCLEDEEIENAATFRSKGRIPILSWKRKGCECALMRSSQPMSGMMQRKRNSCDEKIIHHLAASSGDRKEVFIADVRPQVNAVANMAKGGGYENRRHYVGINVEIAFLGIPNVHVVRRSFRDICNACVDYLDQSVKTDIYTFHESITRSQWLPNVAKILETSAIIVSKMLEDISVLVHCSDGWDRTPQVCCLAQLIMDPFYRTRTGFRALVEREWLLYGHMFADRCGHSAKRGVEGTAQGPIFVQFLDAVFQLVHQYPSAFEFNSKFLVALADASTGGQYLEFHANNEHSRRSLLARACIPGQLPLFQATTDSLWESLCVESKFRNDMYSHKRPRTELPKEGIRASSMRAFAHLVLMPKPELVVIWSDFFFRWSPLYHGNSSRVSMSAIKPSAMPGELQHSAVIKRYILMKRRAMYASKEAERLRRELRTLKSKLKERKQNLSEQKLSDATTDAPSQTRDLQGEDGDLSPESSDTDLEAETASARPTSYRLSSTIPLSKKSVPVLDISHKGAEPTMAKDAALENGTSLNEVKRTALSAPGLKATTQGTSQTDDSDDGLSPKPLDYYVPKHPTTPASPSDASDSQIHDTFHHGNELGDTIDLDSMIRDGSDSAGAAKPRKRLSHSRGSASRLSVDDLKQLLINTSSAPKSSDVSEKGGLVTPKVAPLLTHNLSGHTSSFSELLRGSPSAKDRGNIQTRAMISEVMERDEKTVEGPSADVTPSDSLKPGIKHPAKGKTKEDRARPRLTTIERTQASERLKEIHQIYAELLQTKNHWQKDDDAKECPVCLKTFTMLFRKHHCRICGRVFCRNCALKLEASTDLMKALSGGQFRMCLSCKANIDELNVDSDIML